MGKREARRENQRKKKLRSRLIFGGVAFIAVMVVGFLVWQAVLPSLGEKIPIMVDSSEHVEEGDDPGPFNSNPPTSGRHYAQEFKAGFYTDSSPEAQLPYPEGYLGHNLEHGYVIFWYNCDSLNETGCDTLKSQIQEVMDKYDNFKVIAFPSDSLDVPLAMVSWGQLLRFESFDEGLASQFVKVNRNRAPEPNAE